MFIHSYVQNTCQMNQSRALAKVNSSFETKYNKSTALFYVYFFDDMASIILWNVCDDNPDQRFCHGDGSLYDLP